MELGIDVEKLKVSLNWKHIGNVLVAFFLKRINVFMFILMFLLTVFFVFLWYTCIYKPEWDEVKKQEYIQKKEKSVIFNKNVFDSMVEEMNVRSQRFQKADNEAEDIFRLKK